MSTMSSFRCCDAAVHSGFTVYKTVLCRNSFSRPPNTKLLLFISTVLSWCFSKGQCLLTLKDVWSVNSEFRSDGCPIDPSQSQSDSWSGPTCMLGDSPSLGCGIVFTGSSPTTKDSYIHRRASPVCFCFFWSSNVCLLLFNLIITTLVKHRLTANTDGETGLLLHSSTDKHSDDIRVVWSYVDTVNKHVVSLTDVPTCSKTSNQVRYWSITWLHHALK